MAIQVKKEDVLTFIEQKFDFIERKNCNSESGFDIHDIDFMLGVLSACFKFGLIDSKEYFCYVDRL